MVGETTTDPLIRTKLHRPLVYRNHIQRPHLLERLEKNRQRPLTLVSAPAGYGKSTLVSDWLDSCDSPSAWLSLDEQDNDLGKFLSYLLAAVETIFPHAVSKTMTLVNALTLPPLSTLTGTLVNELDRIEQPFILVLDDYHLIKETAVNNLIAETLKHPPQSFHLVIVGRRDPGLPISTLRAQSKLAEIRTPDLRFSVAETETFLNQVMGIQIDPSTVVAVEEKTEGWVAGLRLAALSMRHQGTLDPKLLEPQVDAQYVMEYLFNEVFSHQPPEINQYLLGTAILDRFSGPLCEAVCLPGVDPLTCEFGGWNFIAWLKSENLFLIPLDPENRWFRYHHLFQKFLINQLKRHCSADEIKTHHAQASVWFFENGFIEEGLRHSLAADDIPGAIQAVARHGHNLMNEQQWPRLERWIGMLPRDRVEQEPELLLLEAWIDHIRHNLSHMAFCLEKVETLVSILPPDDSIKVKQIRAHYEALLSFQHFYMAADGKNALVYSKRACANVPHRHKRALAFAQLFLAGAYQMVGDLENGLSSLQKAMTNNTSQDSTYQALYFVYHCFLYWIDADLIALRRMAERSLILDKAHQLPETVSYGLYFLGVADYHQNELEAAEEKLTAVVKDFYTYNTTTFAYSSFVLALIYQAQGQPDKATEVNKALINIAIDTNNAFILNLAMAFREELALRQGCLPVASRWLKRYHAKPFLPPYRSYMPQLTAVKILLAQNTTDSLRQAADLLDRLHDFLTSIHNNCFQIHVLALQALLHDTRGDDSAALGKLSQALDLAEPGGFIRLFVDLGPQMADLLKRLIKQNIAVDYAGRILSAFSVDAQRVVPGAFLQNQSLDHPIPPLPVSQPPSPWRNP